MPESLTVHDEEAWDNDTNEDDLSYIEDGDSDIDIETGDEDLIERICNLERWTSERDVDISLMKSALADTLSRLCAVERELKQVKNKAKKEATAPAPSRSNQNVQLRNPPAATNALQSNANDTQTATNARANRRPPRPKSMLDFSSKSIPVNPEDFKDTKESNIKRKSSFKEAKPATNKAGSKDDNAPEVTNQNGEVVKENGTNGNAKIGTIAGLYTKFKRNPPPSASKRSSLLRSQSVNEDAKTRREKEESMSRRLSSGRKESKEENKEDDGKVKIILAKKFSTAKKPKPPVRAQSEDVGLRSPKDDAAKFNIRGRSIVVYPPTRYQEEYSAGTAPDSKLQLNWVYGYRGKDCRDNLHQLPNGEFVYNMAGVIVMHDVKENKQRHFTQHTDDVKCVAMHPNKVYFASGQVTGHGDEAKAHVLIWNSSTMETLALLGQGLFERGLCAVEFSTYENGKYLIAFDESNDHVIYLYEWEKGIKITETKVSKEVIFGARWNPKSLLSFVTYGKSHHMFWTFNLETNSLSKKAAIYEQFKKPKYLLALVYTTDGDLVSGDSNGNILLFKDENSKNRVTDSAVLAHKGGVFSLCYLESKEMVLSCGKDGQFSMWSKTLEKLMDYSKISETYGTARCMSYNEVDKIFTVSTSRNCILQYDEELSEETVCVQGHYDEMWGLATHPTEKIFASCAQEQLVCVRDCESKQNIWDYYLEESADCAEFHPTESYLLIGSKSGTIYFLNYETKEEDISLPVARDCINVIKVSPDGKYFAVGCRDANIYLYAWPGDLNSIKKPKTLQGHSSRVTHLDWSSDSDYLQSNSSDYEVLFWQREAALQVLTPAALRDIPWSTWTCPFGFPAMGIWPEGADGTDINACCRSADQKLIATGDDFSCVKLFRYPSAKLKAEFNLGKGHSAHVTCVRFLVGDCGLVTVGGRDSSVMQWSIV